MEPKSPSKLKLSVTGFTQYKRAFRYSAVVLVLVLLLVSAYFVFEPGRADDVFSRSYFTVVLDCGSTGTRVNVYEWKRSGVENRELPVLEGSYLDNSTKSFLQKNYC